eukprot:2756690-Pleurochrysis_carterae.AAC.4
MWCEGKVESVADGISDKKTERARTLLPARAIHFFWPADPERDEPERYKWTILNPVKWNKDVQNAWLWVSFELERVKGVSPLWLDFNLL